MPINNLIVRDLQHVWHPCAQMKDYEIFNPLEIIKAHGSYIELSNGKKIIDAISSWWCKSLGHQHPRLKQALLRQLDKFEHVIFAHTTHETIVTLSEKLARLTSSLNKVMYASDGSCAVEIALKMSLHTRKIQGSTRHLFLSLENSYHGETVGAMSVSDLGIYRDPYEALLFNAQFLSSLPYVHSVDDPLWQDCSEHWQSIETQLNTHEDQLTAIIIEPIIQGAAGMKMYSQDFLRRLRKWSAERDIHLIADEIMTGLGRTGKMLACQHAEIEPDFLCLSKSLTSGWLAMSAMLTKQSIYDLFYDDYEAGKSFLHSHTFSGNALAASVAVETLNLVEEESICHNATIIGNIMREYFLEIAQDTHKLKNIRGIGGIIAADIISDTRNRVGFEIARKAVSLGAYLRPLGNTLYWLPPLNIHLNTLAELKEITKAAILD